MVTATYNRLGQIITRTDQNGSIRQFNFDTLGRPTDDRVTTAASGVDAAVLRISSTYEVRGMLATLTSYNNATVGSGSALNQVQLTYNGFGQLTQERQDHATTIHTGTPAVGYGYDSGGSSSNEIRPSTLTYPNGRQLNYVYNTGMDTTLNRLSTIQDDATTVNLANYVYLGGGTVVQVNYSQPGVTLDLWGGTSGVFAGIDIFGRIVDQKWVTTGGTPTALDEYAYGYDYNSNRLWKQNVVAGSTPALDEQYVYDKLNRLTNMYRGVLSGGTITGTPTREMDYTLDPTGNWSQYKPITAGTPDFTQTRTHTTTNEISAISGGSWVTPAYDANGNTTTMPKPNAPTTSYTAKYDAWNRMVKTSDGGTTVATYQYDGRGRRIIKTNASETRHFYWSNAWQDLEERVGSATTADTQQVWGIRYVDELICRDDATPQRLYVCQDANFRVTALINAVTAAVEERFNYDPYGQSFVLDASSAPTSDAFAWAWRHQGLYEDYETGIIYDRSRFVFPQLGRSNSRDTQGYIDGPNVYQLYASNPINFVDPLGSAALSPSQQEVLSDFESRKDYDYRMHGGKAGPDSAYLWAMIQRLKSGGKMLPTKSCNDSPDYSPAAWNIPNIRRSNNCYSYAANDPNGHRLGTKPQPGEHSGSSYELDPRSVATPYDCGAIGDAAVRDGLVRADCDKPCECGGHKMALLVTTSVIPGHQDYHWYIQNSSGYWSNKHGFDPVSDLDAGGDRIKDPRLGYCPSHS